MNYKETPEIIIKSQDNDLLFGIRQEQRDPIVLLITSQYLVSEINPLGTNDFFGKDKKDLINHSLIDLFLEQQIDTTPFLSALKLCSSSFSQNITLKHEILGEKYSVTIIALHENNIIQYVITMNALDDSYLALKSYINAFINNLPGAVYWKDKEGRYMGCNNFVATMAGFSSPEEMIGKTDYDLCWHEFADDWRLLDIKVIQENTTIEREEKAKLANGKIITELTLKTPLKNQQGEIIGVIGTSLDITERKEMESALHKSQIAASAASQAKTEFLENMRHDIRTPLSGIVGFSEILKSESNEPHIKEYADNLIASSHALLKLMDEVLEAVRVSSGDIPMLKRKFNLQETFEQVIQLHRAKASEKRLDLLLFIDENLPHFAIGDKIRVHRIALELIGNALNFTDSGHVSVTIELVKQENRHLVIKLVVSDSGMGIPQDKQQEIYLQFKRLTPSYQGIYKGAGLGLFVVKQFIDELEGEIYVVSEPHKGTVFTCLIPLQVPLIDDDSGIDLTQDLKTEKPYLTSLAHQKAPLPTASESKITSRVLVVEDNFIAQTVAKALLSAMDCQVDVASNGADALTLYKQNHYDVIFMDIGLGDGMDGYEVTHHIRSRDSETHHIPIIALTAHAGDESKQRCIEAGMDAVLTKPLTQKHASDILKTFIPARQEAPSPELTKARRDLPDTDAEMFQLSQFSLLDIDEALKNCGTNTMLTEMLTLTVQDLPIDLAKMKEAFEHQDYPMVEKTAHKIKGGAVYIGTNRMKYACQYVERYWKTGQRDLFDALYHQAVNSIEETITYIEGWLKKTA